MGAAADWKGRGLELHETVAVRGGGVGGVLTRAPSSLPRGARTLEGIASVSSTRMMRMAVSSGMRARAYQPGRHSAGAATAATVPRPAAPSAATRGSVAIPDSAALYKIFPVSNT